MGIDDLQLPPLSGLANPTSGSLEELRLDGAKRAADRGDGKEAAHQFEKVFATMLVRELRRSMPKSPFGEGPGADVYEGWFDDHLGGALARNDALGLAGMIKASITRTQAARDAQATIGGRP